MLTHQRIQESEIQYWKRQGGASHFGDLKVNKILKSIPKRDRRASDKRLKCRKCGNICVDQLKHELLTFGQAANVQRKGLSGTKIKSTTILKTIFNKKHA